jgi:hypothetical protein
MAVGKRNKERLAQLRTRIEDAKDETVYITAHGYHASYFGLSF